MTIEILTGLLVIITAAYAYFTFEILKANRSSVNAMVEQTNALTRPYITINTFLPSKGVILMLRIRNTGKTAASNLRLSIDRDFFQFGEKQRKGGNLRTMNAFTMPISCFPPGAELLFYLAQGFVVFADNADPEVTPLSFSISAQYSWGTTEASEVTPIDLEPLLQSTPMPSPLIDKLDDIKKAIEKC